MAAKMAEVASEAGVSPGLAYHYFPSKEAIFLTLVRQSIRSAEELNAIVQRIPGTPRDRLNRMVAGMLERRRKDPEFFQFFYQAMAGDSLPADLREQISSRACPCAKSCGVSSSRGKRQAGLWMTTPTN
jgi:AcrR family transcriptional regulator